MFQLIFVLVLVVPVAAILLAQFLSKKILAKSPGNERMQELAKLTQDGAMAFLKTEYQVLGLFVVLIALVIMAVVDKFTWPFPTAICFLFGAFTSALTGWVGMKVATNAAVRTTEAAKSKLSEALRVAFSSGLVMGLMVVGLGLLSVSVLFLQMTQSWGMFTADFKNADALIEWAKVFEPSLNALFGFSFGASTIALFARVGGGIFTKAADVGADLVGKVESGIPEDDPRNPAVIADNVGDNVGDVAGMGADLYESYVGSILAAMAIAASTITTFHHSDNTPAHWEGIFLPLGLAALGILAAFIGAAITGLSASEEKKKIITTLQLGLLASATCMGFFGWMLIKYLDIAVDGGGKEWGISGSLICGLVGGFVIGKLTEYYTSGSNKPTRFVAKESGTGPATNVIAGLSVGMESVVAPIIVISIMMFLSYEWAKFYGIAISAVGMLSTLGISLAVDAYGPVADNAGGLAEMAGLKENVRERTDALDSVGNTTAAMGKGFAIGSAALTALVFFKSYAIKAGSLAGSGNQLTLDIMDYRVIIGLLIGAAMPFLFSALTMKAVGEAAGKMIQEVRKQFREKPGIMEGTERPDYNRCIAISTQAALWKMGLPGALAIGTPLIIKSTSLGLVGVGGLLAGSLISGVMLAIMMANAGGAWDNAKKCIEAGDINDSDGNPTTKGSNMHKAAVVGDTVGDPFKDTSGPSLNILIKLMCVVALVFAAA